MNVIVRIIFSIFVLAFFIFVGFLGSFVFTYQYLIGKLKLKDLFNDNRAN